MTPKSRKVLLFVAEYAIGGGILWWLMHRQVLDLTPLRSIPATLMLGGVAFALVINYLASIRIKLLLGDQGMRISVLRCFFFNCMAIFYSMFLPGGFSGDAARAYYLLRDVETNRGALLGSLLLDRILGLLAMMGLGTASSAFLVLSNRWLLTYFLYLSGLLVVGLAGLGYLLWAKPMARGAAPRSLLVRAYTFVHDALARLNIAGHSRKTLAYAMTLSILIHCLSIVLIYVCSFHNDSGLGLLGVFSVAPFGLLANAIPISPGGLGVGEQSFEFLYRLAGGRNGASSFLTARMFLYSPALVGVLVAAVFFLRLQKLPGLRKSRGR